MKSTIFTGSQEGGLLVTGLKCPESIRDDFSELLLHITAQQSCIQNVSFKSYFLTMIDHKPAAQVCLSFGPLCMEAFCSSIMMPQFGEHLNKISEYGLLGYSPIAGSDFEQIWNMVVVKSSYAFGASRMEEIQFRALEISQENSTILPLWIKIMTFVGESLLEPFLLELLLELNPHIDKNVVEDMLVMISDRSKARDQAGRGTWTFAKVETVADKLLQSLAKSFVSHKSEKELLLDAKIAVTKFFEATERACALVKEIKNFDTKARQDIFNELYDLTKHAYEAFEANEELMKLYTKLKLQYALEASALVVSTLSTTFAVFSAPRAVAQAQGALTATGVVSAMASASRLVSENLARSFTQSISAGALQSVFAGAQVAIYIRTVIGAVKLHQKEQFCKELSHLLWQVWQMAAESITLLRWVYMTGDKFCFHEDSSRQWEQFLKNKIQKEVKLEYKSPEFVILYLRSQVESIERAKELFFKRHTTILGPLEEVQLNQYICDADEVN